MYFSSVSGTSVYSSCVSFTFDMSILHEVDYSDESETEDGELTDDGYESPPQESSPRESSPQEEQARTANELRLRKAVIASFLNRIPRKPSVDSTLNPTVE